MRSGAGDDGQVLSRVEAEAQHHPTDDVGVVARQHAEMITGLIAHTRRKGNLDMPGGPLQWRPGRAPWPARD